MGERIWKRIEEIKGARRIKGEIKAKGTHRITIKVERIRTLTIEIKGIIIEIENTWGETKRIKANNIRSSWWKQMS